MTNAELLLEVIRTEAEVVTAPLLTRIEELEASLKLQRSVAQGRAAQIAMLVADIEALKQSAQ